MIAANDRPCCLLFHRIGDADPQLAPVAPRDGVSADTFRRVIQQIAETRVPISVPDLVSGIRNRNVPKRAVAVTFDDGFADNLIIALPILEEFRVPATIYVTTGFVDRSVAPFHYDLAETVCRCDRLKVNLSGQAQKWRLDSDTQRADCYASVVRGLKFASRSLRHDTMLHLRKSTGVEPDQSSRFLSIDQLRQLAASPLITIGAHTHEHLVLDTIEPNEMRTDIAVSHRLLQEWLGRPVTHFSYPFGHHNRSVRRAVREQGFESSMATDRRLWWLKNDPFSINRLEVQDRDVCLAPRAA